MIRTFAAFIAYFRKQPVTLVSQAGPRKKQEFSAATQNRLLGAHMAHVGGLDGKKK